MSCVSANSGNSMQKWVWVQIFSSNISRLDFYIASVILVSSNILFEI